MNLQAELFRECNHSFLQQCLKCLTLTGPKSVFKRRLNTAFFSENIPECFLMAWFMAGRIRYPELLDVIGWNSTDGQIINTLFALDV